MEPINTVITALGYFGLAVFAMSGALAAGRHNMDLMGFALVGTITGIGGGTLRDLLIDRPVWWTQNPEELVICIVVSLLTFFLIPASVARRSWVNWSDALGLACFSVVGCHIAIGMGVSTVVAVFMGVLTATGGGLIRDILTGNKPMVTAGQLYASAALLGSASYVGLLHYSIDAAIAQLIAFAVCLCVRASAIAMNIRMGPPGEFIRIGGTDNQS